MKVKLALLTASLAASTVAVFFSRTKAKGMDPEIGNLVSQILAVVKDGRDRHYRLHRDLECTVEFLEEGGTWSPFNLESSDGRRRFRLACRVRAEQKIRKLTKGARIPDDNPFEYFQPEVTFFELLYKVRKHEERKRRA